MPKIGAPNAVFCVFDCSAYTNIQIKATTTSWTYKSSLMTSTILILQVIYFFTQIISQNSAVSYWIWHFTFGERQRNWNESAAKMGSQDKLFSQNMQSQSIINGKFCHTLLTKHLSLCRVCPSPHLRICTTTEIKNYTSLTFSSATLCNNSWSRSIVFLKKQCIFTISRKSKKAHHHVSHVWPAWGTPNHPVLNINMAAI